MMEFLLPFLKMKNANIESMTREMKCAMTKDIADPTIPIFGISIRFPITLTTAATFMAVALITGLPIPTHTAPKIQEIAENTIPNDTMSKTLAAPKYFSPNNILIAKSPKK